MERGCFHFPQHGQVVRSLHRSLSWGPDRLWKGGRLHLAVIIALYRRKARYDTDGMAGAEGGRNWLWVSQVPCWVQWESSLLGGGLSSWVGMGSVRSSLVISPQGWCRAYLALVHRSRLLIVINKFRLADRTDALTLGTTLLGGQFQSIQGLVPPPLA